MNDLAIITKNDPNALLLMWQGCSRYAYKIAMKYRAAAALNGAVDDEDLKQCAFLGFYEAVQDFDPLRGDFLTLLSFHVRSECRKALGLCGRERKEHYTTVSLETPISEDLTIADTLEDESSSTPFQQTELRNDIEKALRRIPRKMADAIYLHDIQGKSIAQTARECETDEQDVCRLRKKGFYRLRANRALREYIPFRHKTLAAFRLDGSSVVEDIVIRRLDGWK